MPRLRRTVRHRLSFRSRGPPWPTCRCSRPRQPTVALLPASRPPRMPAGRNAPAPHGRRARAAALHASMDRTTAKCSACNSSCSSKGRIEGRRRCPTMGRAPGTRATTTTTTTSVMWWMWNLARCGSQPHSRHTGRQPLLPCQPLLDLARRRLPPRRRRRARHTRRSEWRCARRYRARLRQRALRG